MFKLSFIILLSVTSSFAQYYKTLPKGVRSLVYKNISTNDIDSSYNQTNTRSPYTFNIKVDYEALSQIDHSLVQDALIALSPYPQINDLVLGEYKVGGQANIKAEVFGFGYGITNKLTAYAGLPVFDATVKVNYSRSQGNNYSQIAQNLQQEPNNNTAQTYGSVLEEFAGSLDLNAAILQGIAQNQMGFEPVGDWEGHGLGDMELGLMYNFLDRDTYGMMLSGGLVAPTGKTDDPDILQDIAFGDGQWDAFVELGGGYRLNNALTFNTFGRFTYQFASIKELRKPTSKDFKYSADSGEYTEKLGNKFLYNINTDYSVNDWLSINSGYEFLYQQEAEYFSNSTIENDMLAYGTQSSSHHLKMGARLHTVTLFQKKKFLAPASIEFKADMMLTGSNTPNVNIYELEFRMFF